MQGDLGDTEAIPEIVENVLERFERIDILVNNAGIFVPSTLANAPLEELDPTSSVWCTHRSGRAGYD